jgi:hypothetical protein
MDDPGDIRDLILQVVELRKEVAEQRLALERLAALLDAGSQLLRVIAPPAQTRRERLQSPPSDPGHL